MSSKKSGLGALILSIVLICLDCGAFATLYFQTLSANFLQNIFLLTAVCSLTIPLCILLASQLKIYHSSLGKISNINRNGWKDPVLDNLVPTPIAMPEI
jgi:Ni/Fe-hydrogenase subunit HybB-like protein